MDKQIDERRILTVPGDREETLDFCVLHFIQHAKMSIANHGYFYVALSGGSTPKEMFKQLTSSPYKEMIEWKKVHLFWSDERTVGPEHPDSNYKMAMDAGLSSVGIPSQQIHRPQGENDAQEAALAYEKEIVSTLGSRSFDLVMLGMGEDGHTASLFPETPGLDVADRIYIANRVPQKETVRLTMTFTTINNARNIAIYVMGASKQAMIRDVLAGGDYPVGRVGTAEHKALWIADVDAAKLMMQ